MKRSHCSWMVVVLFLVVGCSQEAPDDLSETQPAAEKSAAIDVLSVFTVNYPLQYFAERIGGDLVEVTFPAPADEDPAYWSPDPETVAAYQQADLILLNGVSYAKWLERATMPSRKLVDTSAGFQNRWIPLAEGPVHTHGPEGEHSHKGYAFTTWLDPQLAVEQARAVGAALAEALPEHRARLEASQERLVEDLQGLDADLEAVTQEIGEEPVLFSHPVYQYLAARYELNSLSLHWEPGEIPSEDQWLELENVLVEHPARWMIWEDTPSQATVERLSALGIESLVYSPCANRPASGDLLSVMSENVAALQTITTAK